MKKDRLNKGKERAQVGGTHIVNRVFQTSPTQEQLMPQLNPKFEPQLGNWKLPN